MKAYWGYYVSTGEYMRLNLHWQHSNRKVVVLDLQFELGRAENDVIETLSTLPTKMDILLTDFSS